MTEALSTLLTYLIAYGYPIVAGCIFVGYLGIPVPSEALLLAAGALASGGSLNIWILISLVTITALTGDIFGYWIGNKYGVWCIKKFGPLLRFDQNRVKKTSGFLNRWGVWSIFITRWLLTPVAVPINILSGITNYPLKKFLCAAFCGEILWGCLFISLGYWLGANWLSLLDYINNFLSFVFFGTAGVILVSSTIWILKKRAN